MDDGCNYGTAAWGSLEGASVLGIPNSTVEIETMRIMIEKTEDFQCPFGEVRASEGSVNGEKSTLIGGSRGLPWKGGRPRTRRKKAT